ncbi:hypothetical protein pb186bvf_012944 [Paramecium bursaria]
MISIQLEFNRQQIIQKQSYVKLEFLKKYILIVKKIIKHHYFMGKIKLQSSIINTISYQQSAYLYNHLDIQQIYQTSEQDKKQNIKRF